MIKHIIDGTSVGVAITTLLGFLPPLAALASLIWTCLQIYEWYKKRKQHDQLPKGE